MKKIVHRVKKAAQSHRSANLVFGLIILLQLFWICWGNHDFAKNHVFLYTDELMSYTHVNAILHPKSFSDFCFQIFDGNDHRYGRIFFNLTALVAFPFERAFGEAGQIIAARMFNALVLLAAYIIATLMLVKAHWRRVVLLALLCVLPSTPYFSAMPKPEPLQLLFFVLFLYCFLKKPQAFGPHWILLGLSFGAKISILPVVVVFFGYSAYLNRGKKFPNEKALIACAKGAGFFLLGLGIAVPFLFKALYSPAELLRYLAWTFFFTEHMVDNTTVTFFSWITFMATNWFDTGQDWLPALCLFIGTVTGIVVAWKRKDKDKSARLLAAAGLFFMLLVMSQVKRVWGMYLHVGSVILILGVFRAIEKERQTKIVWGVATSCLMVVVIRLYPVHDTYYLLSTRTSYEVHRQLVKEYDYFRSYLKDLSLRNGRRLVAIYDPRTYKPEPNEYFDAIFAWGNKVDFDVNPDVIILDKISDKDGAALITATGHEQWQASRDKIARHLASAEKANCEEGPCFKLLKHPFDMLRVYQRIDLH